MPFGIRTRRAHRFGEVYGIGTTLNSQTGLPDSTQAPKAPKLCLNNLHVSTARTWSKLDRKRKQTISEDVFRENGVIAAFGEEVRLDTCTKIHQGNIYFKALRMRYRAFCQVSWKHSTLLAKHWGWRAGEDKTGMAFMHGFNQNMPFFSRSNMSFRCGFSSFMLFTWR